MALALGALLMAATAAPFTPALASPETEATYSRYHQAVEAARVCRDLTFDQGDIDRMAGVIHAKIGGDIGAKRLSLLTQAQEDARKLVDDKGCESSEVEALLALYDAELAPVVN
jgi:hypothetical protein